MIIRCPYCEFTRTVNPGKIPSTAELATCPKCGQRFRFRTLPKDTEQTRSTGRSDEAAERARPKPLPADRAGLPVSVPPSAQSGHLGLPGQTRQGRGESSAAPLSTSRQGSNTSDASSLSASRQGRSAPASSSLSAEVKRTTADTTKPSAQSPATAPLQETEPAPRFAESAGPADIWDAVDSLHKRWQREERLLSEAEREPLHEAADADDALPQSPPRPSAAPDSEEHTATHAATAAGAAAMQGEAAELPFFRKAGHSGGAAAYIQAQGLSQAHPTQTKQAGLLPDTRNADTRRPPKQATTQDASAATNAADWDAAPKTPVEDAEAAAELRAQEKVERELRRLRATPTPADAPIRDLGLLTEHDAPAQTHMNGTSEAFPPRKTGDTSAANGFFGAPRKDAGPVGVCNGSDDPSGASLAPAREADMETSSIAWEEPARLGWFRSFFKTVHDAMFNGQTFFSDFTPSGSLTQAYLFFMLMGYAVIAGSVVWTKLACLLSPALRTTFVITKDVPMLLLTAPPALGLMLIFVSGCLRLTALPFVPKEVDFHFCFALLSYAAAPLLLCIIPFVGPVIGSLWFLFTLIIACRQALRLSRAACLLVPLPSALLLLGGMAWYYWI